MINKVFTNPLATTPQNEDCLNNADYSPGTNSHHMKELFQNGICAAPAVTQVKKTEKTQEKSFSENPSEPGQSMVAALEEIKRNPQNTAPLEFLQQKYQEEAGKRRRISAIIKDDAVQQADRLIPRDKQWLTFLRDFFKQTPIPASCINNILSLQAKVREVEEIIFFLEDCSFGYGNLNLFIEFLRNFIRLSPNTLKLIRFSGCKGPLREKLPNLLSGLPDSDMDDLIIPEVKRQRLSLTGTRTDKIFGIPYIIQPIIPDELSSKNILQIYTVWDPHKFYVLEEAPLFQITNYKWFPYCVSNELLKNRENHLPIYPYEVSRNTSTLELLRTEIANCLQTMNREIHDTEALTHFFSELLQSAKENKIYLALSYHAGGMMTHQYYNYSTAAKKCFRDKPVIIIAPITEKRFGQSEQEKEELINTGKVRFSTNYSLHFATEKSLKDTVTVFEFDFLPKRLFELVCYFSNIPIYAPGASTANIAQCLNKPYLGVCGHELPTTSKLEVSNRWVIANHAFYFNLFSMQRVKSALLTMSKEEIGLSDIKKRGLWRTAENIHLKLWTINETITSHILEKRGLILTLLPHFFNGTDPSQIHDYPNISAAERENYFARLLDENRLPDFCQYICDQSEEILLDYMSQVTKPGDTFYDLATELQQKALHPDNNMMLEVLERHLPNWSNPDSLQVNQ